MQRGISGRSPVSSLHDGRRNISASARPSGSCLWLSAVITVCSSGWNWLSEIVLLCVRVCVCVCVCAASSSQWANYCTVKVAHITTHLKKSRAPHFHHGGRRRRWESSKAESEMCFLTAACSRWAISIRLWAARRHRRAALMISTWEFLTDFRLDSLNYRRRPQTPTEGSGHLLERRRHPVVAMQPIRPSCEQVINTTNRTLIQEH